jgi:hypothetical protein
MNAPGVKPPTRLGTETIRWYTSPACLRMLDYLACKGPATSVQMAEALHIARNYAHALVRNILLPAGVVHIPAWRINERGCASPIIAIGPGKSKRKPKPETAAERNARRRKSLLELYGADITNALVNHSRITWIVIDGQRVRTASHQSHIGGRIVGQVSA